MLEIIRIAATVGTPIALLGLVCAFGYFAYTRYLKHEEEKINSLPEAERAIRTDNFLTRYGIDGKNLPLKHKLTLIKDELDKRHRRSILYVILLAVVFVICFGIAAFVYRPGSGSTPSALNVRVQEFRYSNLLKYAQGTNSMPSVVPASSWLRKQPAGTFMTFSGPVDEEHLKTPHIPEGESLLDFSVEYQGDMAAIVDGVYLDIINVAPIPETGSFEGLLPVIEPVEERAILERSRPTIRLYDDKKLRYADKEGDILRLDAIVGDAEEPGVFECRLRLDYHVGSVSRKAESDVFFLAKVHGGRTNRAKKLGVGNAKAPSQGSSPNAPSQSELSALSLPRNQTKPDLYSTGMYEQIAMMESPSECTDPLVGDLVTYLDQKLKSAVLADKRLPLEAAGFLRKGTAIAADAFAQRTKRSYSPTGNGKHWEATYSVFNIDTSEGDIDIYGGRQTREYGCVVKCVHQIMARGTEPDREAATKLVLAWVSKEDLDAAAKIDTLPLLALLRTRDSFDWIVRMLDDPNPVVRFHAANIFGFYRYRPATKHLSRLIDVGDPLVVPSAIYALILNGDEATASNALSLFLAGSIDINDARIVAEVVVSVAPDLTRRILGNEHDSLSKSDRGPLVSKAIRQVLAE